MNDLFLLEEFIKEALLDEARKKRNKRKKRKSKKKSSAKRKTSKHHPNYSAPKGSKRAKQLDATKADLKSGDPKRIQRAYRRREKMEKKARKDPSFVNKPRSDSKK